MEAKRTSNLFSKSLFVSIVFFILFVLLATGTATAATYYVATTGNDANPGTEASPWLTPVKATTSIASGDTVIFKAGTYTRSALNGYWITISTSNVTFKSENPAIFDRGGSNHAIFDGQNQIFGIMKINADNVTVDGIEFKRAFHSTNKAGVGIRIEYKDYATVKRCYFHHIGAQVTDTSYGNGPAVLGTTGGPCDHTTLDSNIVHDCGRTGTSAPGVYATALSRLDHHFYITLSNSVIKNNLNYAGDTPFAGSVYEISNYGTGGQQNNQFINNTIVGNQLSGAGLYPEYTAGINIWAGTVNNTIIANNLIWTNSAQAIRYYNATIGTGNRVYNNLTNKSAIYDIQGVGGGPVTSSGNITNCVTDQFVDSANDDYHLKSSAQSIGLAHASYLPDYDLDGIPRPKGAVGEAGAYEYQESTAAVPVAHYQMDEGRGQVVTDSSGNGNHAMMGNKTISESIDPAWSSGMTGYGLLFAGSNDVATIPHKAALDNLKKFTVSAWINPTASGGAPRIISKESAKGFDEFYLCISPTTGYLGVALYDTTGAEIGSDVNNVIMPNQWSHVVVTYDDAGDRKCHLYVNGFEFKYRHQDAGTGTLKTSGNDWKIGNRHAGNRPFDGRIDNLRIYNRALSASEVADLYNQEN